MAHTSLIAVSCRGPQQPDRDHVDDRDCLADRDHIRNRRYLDDRGGLADRDYIPDRRLRFRSPP